MKQVRGFTLIELAIVLVIITLLVGGLAMPLSAQIQARRIAETKKTLEEAREAIMGYAMSHTATPTTTCTCVYEADTTLDVVTPGSTCPVSLCPTTGTTTLTLPITRHYLPCPDAQTDSEPGVDNDGDGNLSDANNGREDRKADGTCMQNANAGNFPWVTLSTAEQDAWGNRLRYATHADLTDNTKGFHNESKPNPGDSWNKVCSTNDCSEVIADDVPVVLISRGANGWGALNINGNTLATPTSSDELGNQDADRRYVSRPPSKIDDAAGEFDDITTWLSFRVLLNRACPAGGCP